MKKGLFLIVCVVAILPIYAQESTQDISREVIIPGDIVDSLVQHVKLTSDHTKPEVIINQKWDYYFMWIFSVIAGVLAIPALILSFKTANMTEKTARNTRRINQQAQMARFRDLIRHLYRNKVCVCAIQWKLSDSGFDRYYPSEEHMLKLKVLPEDMRLERFDNNTHEHYEKLHELELLFRNYSIEVDVALGHLKSKVLSDDVKKEDLRMLDFKSQYLTLRICELMNKTGMPIDDSVVRSMLLKEEYQYTKGGRESHDRDNVPQREGVGYCYYDDQLGLTQQLDDDISREYNVIKLIEFPQ